VFASDVYSLGVTMYQMLTGFMPYDTPAPADWGRLMTGELLSSPRVKNPKVPKAIADIVLKAMAPEIHNRYQRASDVIADILEARGNVGRKTPPAIDTGGPEALEIHTRLKAREAPQPRFCWHCRKPLHARSDRCPFCGEAQ